MIPRNQSLKGTPGKLIAVEGLDGSGKSTQIYLVKRWLELEGFKVAFTEWNSSDLVKEATRKGKKRKLLTPTTFSLIHCTDFADRYERQILPLMRAGFIVLADRFMFTAFARDAVRGCDPTWLREMYSFVTRPDITFFFKVPVETAVSRILGGRPELKYHEAGLDLGLSTDPEESFKLFQSRIYEEYLNMAMEFNFTMVDGSESPNVQQEKLRNIIRQRIDLPKYKWRDKK